MACGWGKAAADPMLCVVILPHFFTLFFLNLRRCHPSSHNYLTAILSSPETSGTDWQRTWVHILPQAYSFSICTRMEKVSWSKMDDEEKDYVRSCDVCQRDKTSRRKKYGLLQPLGPSIEGHTFTVSECI